MFSKDALPQNGTGASSLRTTAQNQVRGDMGRSDNDGGEAAAQDEAFESLNAEFVGRGGESHVMENALEHIITRVTDEGLVIDIFTIEDQALFEPGTAISTDLLELVVYLIADIVKTVRNGIAIEGHVPTGAIVLANNPVWDDSTKAANAVRKLFEATELVNETRILRVSQGNLVLRIQEAPLAVQPNPFAVGETVVVPRTDVAIEEEFEIGLAEEPDGMSLSEVIACLNALGVAPRDIIDILKSIKASKQQARFMLIYFQLVVVGAENLNQRQLIFRSRGFQRSVRFVE